MQRNYPLPSYASDLFMSEPEEEEKNISGEGSLKIVVKKIYEFYNHIMCIYTVKGSRPRPSPNFFSPPPVWSVPSVAKTFQAMVTGSSLSGGTSNANSHVTANAPRNLHEIHHGP